MSQKQIMSNSYIIFFGIKIHKRNPPIHEKPTTFQNCLRRENKRVVRRHYHVTIYESLF